MQKGVDFVVHELGLAERNRQKTQLQSASEEAGSEGVLLLYPFFHKNVAGHSPVEPGRKGLWGVDVHGSHKGKRFRRKPRPDVQDNFPVNRVEGVAVIQGEMPTWRSFTVFW